MKIFLATLIFMLGLSRLTSAADEHDDILASSDYCPITNFDNAEAANNPVPVKKSSEMTAEEIRVSKILHDAFPAYVNSLNLRDENGKLLTLDKNGNGSDDNLADEKIIAMLNPMNFIGREDVTTAKFFRIRHGSADRDTSLAVPALLALKLQNSGVDVNFFVPFGQGHGGDYDLPELFDWIDSVCKD